MKSVAKMDRSSLVDHGRVKNIAENLGGSDPTGDRSRVYLVNHIWNTHHDLVNDVNQICNDSEKTDRDEV